jgi:uncharacterized protein (DUF488 family)
LEIYTTGFTKKSAAEFFEPLKRLEIKRLVDVRLNNVSQLAGFTKKTDLAYFLREIAQIEYTHEPLLAPTESMLRAYRRGELNWEAYAEQFNSLLRERHVDLALDRTAFQEKTVLLCSENGPQRCHRRLVAEFLQDRWQDVNVTHL